MGLGVLTRSLGGLVGQVCFTHLPDSSLGDGLKLDSGIFFEFYQRVGGGGVPSFDTVLFACCAVLHVMLCFCYCAVMK